MIARNEQTELEQYVIAGLRRNMLLSLWARQRTTSAKALNLIGRLRWGLWTAEIARFYRKAKRLYEWLLLPENAELWKKPRLTVPGERNTREYREWREAVLKRDDWTCQQCNTEPKTLVAHHLKAYKDYPALRTVVSNGQTLCEGCHRQLK